MLFRSLRVFVDKLAVANAEGCLDAFSVGVVKLVAFPFHFILLPFFNKIILKCFMHTMEFLIGFHSDWLSHLIYFANKSGLSKRKENPSTC